MPRSEFCYLDFSKLEHVLSAYPSRITIIPNPLPTKKSDLAVDVEKFVEAAFEKDGRIRYVGVVNREFHVLASRMREEVQSLTPSESDRNFVQLMPPIIVDAAEKLSPMLGVVESVIIRYAKVVLVFFAEGSYLVVLSFGPDLQRPFMSALTEWVQRLASQYLTE
jgi:hypothetical protein